MQNLANILETFTGLDARSAQVNEASCFRRADGIAARRFSIEETSECAHCRDCAEEFQVSSVQFSAEPTPPPAAVPTEHLKLNTENCAADEALRDSQLKRATALLHSLRAVAALLQQMPGLSFNRACALAGAPKASVWRAKDDLCREFKTPATVGEDGTAVSGWMLDLDHQPAEALLRAVAPELKTGRPPKFQLTEDEVNALRCLTLARSTMDASHFSIAVEQFAQHPACRPETRDIITAELERAARLRRDPSWPVSIRRLGYVTTEEAAMFRGEKTEQNFSFSVQRGLFWIDEDGSRHELSAHSIREYDDQSDNEARAYFDPDTQQHEIARQALYSYDVFSAAMLSLMQVSRARDEYRIEDIAEFALADFTTNGIPAILRLEAGRRWQNKFFHGFAPEVAGWPEDEKWGGLTALCRVINVHGSRSKGAIESSFNTLQVLSAHQSTSLGRFRGEFEKATRKLIHAHLTGDCHDFWSADVSAGRMAEIARQFNLRPKTRANFGRDKVAPADLLRGAKGVALPDSERWRFCPVKKLATVRNGHVQITVEHYPTPFRFRINGERQDVHLDHGYQVLIAFSPSRPEEGCHVFNAECTTRNRENYGRGERIILAPRAELAPQVDLSGMADLGAKKEARAAVRRSFRSITQSGVAVDHQQDSRGHAVRIERDSNAERGTRNAEPIQRGTRNAERGMENEDPSAPVERVSAFRIPHSALEEDAVEVVSVRRHRAEHDDDVEVIRL